MVVGLKKKEKTQLKSFVLAHGSVFKFTLVFGLVSNNLIRFNPVTIIEHLQRRRSLGNTAMHVKSPLSSLKFDSWCFFENFAFDYFWPFFS